MIPAVKSRGIIFRGDMVRAILDGRKTQTRRVIKDTGLYAIDARFHPAENVARERRALAEQCPYGVPGDELYVKERVRYSVEHANHYYEADDSGVGESIHVRLKPKALPALLMPRWASRLTLVVESVRVERLSAITEEDAKAEGFEPYTFDFEVQQADGSVRPAPIVYSARDQYIRAFRAMHERRGKRASKSKREPNTMTSDPWLWVVTFRKQGGAS